MKLLSGNCWQGNNRRGNSMGQTKPTVLCSHCCQSGKYPPTNKTFRSHTVAVRRLQRPKRLIPDQGNLTPHIPTRGPQRALCGVVGVELCVRKLEAILHEHNKDGWNLAEVVPDNPNLIIWIVRLLLLVLTLGLWTLSNGYLLILEKPVEQFGTANDGDNHRESGRKEPRLFAQR